MKGPYNLSEEKHMTKSTFTKTLAVLLNFALVGPSIAGPMAPTATAMPDSFKALTPSPRLGYIDTFYQGSTEHPVVLIQDLHANYGVQKNIYGILQQLQPVVAQGDRKMTIGLEGAWGDIDLGFVRKETEKVRKNMGEFLMKEAEISGMEHFAAMSPTPVNLVGIENREDYMVHQELFQKSLAARLALAQKVDQLREAINDTKGKGSRALLRLWKISDDFHAGKIGLDELSKKLGAPLENYGQAEAALEQQKMDIVQQKKGDDALFLKNLVKADQDLELLGRLLRQQLTLEEVNFVGPHIPEMLSIISGLIPGDNMSLWKDTIQTAIDHYAVALVRNEPMSARAYELAQKYPETSIVIVTGGFHTAGITQFLQSKKVSYVVIAPIVASHTAKDEALYYKRMMDIHVSDAEIAQGAAQVRPDQASIVQARDYLAVKLDNTKAAAETFFRAVPFFRAGATADQVKAALAAAAPAGTTEEVAAINAGAQTKDLVTPNIFRRVYLAIRNFFNPKAAEIQLATNTETLATDIAFPGAKGPGIGAKLVNGVVTVAKGVGSVYQKTSVKVASTAVGVASLLHGESLTSHQQASSFGNISSALAVGAALIGGWLVVKHKDKITAAARSLINGAA
jgi:hypothetical protein